VLNINALFLNIRIMFILHLFSLTTSLSQQFTVERAIAPPWPAFIHKTSKLYSLCAKSRL